MRRVVTIHHIFISDGHNFFGHHGQPPGKHAVRDVEEVECVAGKGLKGDRFFEHKDGYKGQITFFALEVFDELRSALGIDDLSPGSVRRNVIVSGLELNDLVGKEFEVQGVRFFGVEECKPCYWMDVALSDGARDLMTGRGGLRCRILTDGPLRVGKYGVRV